MSVALVHDPPERGHGGVEVYLDLLEQGLAAANHPVLRLTSAQLGERGVEGLEVIHAHHVSDQSQLARFAELDEVAVMQSIHDLRLGCPGANRLLRDGRRCVRTASRGCWRQATMGACAGVPRVPWRAYAQVSRWADWRAAVRRLPTFVVASSFMRDLMARSELPLGQIHIHPYPVRVPSRALRAASEVQELLFAGRLTDPDKGVRLFVDVLAELPPNVRARVAGDGPALPWLRRRLQQLGLADRVELEGWVAPERMSELMELAALVVLPSCWPEPSGIVGLEAMAHGRPVVATDVGGIAEWLRDGEGGLLRAAGNARALAGAVADLLAEPELRDRMGRAGRARVVDRHGLEAHVQALTQLYAQVAA